MNFRTFIFKIRKRLSSPLVDSQEGQLLECRRKFPQTKVLHLCSAPFCSSSCESCHSWALFQGQCHIAQQTSLKRFTGKEDSRRMVVLGEKQQQVEQCTELIQGFLARGGCAFQGGFGLVNFVLCFWGKLWDWCHFIVDILSSETTGIGGPSSVIGAIQALILGASQGQSVFP